MPEKHSKLTVTDDLIREALCREIDTIEAPSTAAAWQRLQLHREALTSAPDKSFRRVRARTRYLALAAALMLFVFGGWGFYRAFYPGGFHGAIIEPDLENAEIMSAEESDERISLDKSVSGYLAGWAPAEDYRDGEKWPPDALNGYTREEVFTRDAKSGVIYHAALYARDQEALLWIQSGVISREQFAADLEQLLGALPPLPILEADQLRFSINNKPALIWEKEDRHYLLIDLSGRLKDADLSRLLPEN